MNVIAQPHRTQEFEKPVEMTFWPAQVKTLICIYGICHFLVLYQGFNSSLFFSFRISTSRPVRVTNIVYFGIRARGKSDLLLEDMRVFPLIN